MIAADNPGLYRAIFVLASFLFVYSFFVQTSDWNLEQVKYDPVYGGEQGPSSNFPVAFMLAYYDLMMLLDSPGTPCGYFDFVDRLRPEVSLDCAREQLITSMEILNTPVPYGPSPGSFPGKRMKTMTGMTVEDVRLISLIGMHSNVVSPEGYNFLLFRHDVLGLDKIYIMDTRANVVHIARSTDELREFLLAWRDDVPRNLDSRHWHFRP